MVPIDFIMKLLCCCKSEVQDEDPDLELGGNETIERRVRFDDEVTIEEVPRDQQPISPRIKRRLQMIARQNRMMREQRDQQMMTREEKIERIEKLIDNFFPDQ